jgi:hypothetical protein
MIIKRRYALAIVGLVLALLCGLLIYRQTTSHIKVITIPNDAQITIDGKNIGKSREISLKPGRHNLVAKRSGFEDYKTSFSTKVGQTLPLTIHMNYNSSVGYNYLESNQDQQLQLEAQTGQYIDQQNKIIRSDNPIISLLPVTDPRFTIDYGVSQKHPNTAGALAIYINTYSPDGRQAALGWIKAQGFDTSTMEIIFTSDSGQ